MLTAFVRVVSGPDNHITVVVAVVYTLCTGTWQHNIKTARNFRYHMNKGNWFRQFCNTCILVHTICSQTLFSWDKELTLNMPWISTNRWMDFISLVSNVAYQLWHLNGYRVSVFVSVQYRLQLSVFVK